MAKKSKKKMNGGLVALLAIVCLVIGLFGGAAAGVVTANENYVIPDTVQVTTSTAGEFDVTEIKSADMSAHFLELGNKYTGDCVFIKVGETEILVDAGSRADSVDDIYNYVSPYVDGALDYVIVTHAHQDHYAGFSTKNYGDSLFSKFENGITTVITFPQSNQKANSTLYNNFNANLKTLETAGTTVRKVSEFFVNKTPTSEAEYALSETVSLEFLYQKYYDEKATTENDYSVCFQIKQTVGGDTYRYLFTGDLEEGGEKSLVTENAGKLGKTRLFKAGHHGSKTSSSEALLSVIQPDVVCICACAGSPEYTKNNNNQFPTQAFVDRVFRYTRDVYVTSLCLDYDAGRFTSMNGNIALVANGKDYSMKFTNSTLKLEETDWFRQNRTLPA